MFGVLRTSVSRNITNKQQNCVEDKQFPVTVETRRTYCPLNTDNQSVIARLDTCFSMYHATCIRRSVVDIDIYLPEPDLIPYIDV